MLPLEGVTVVAVEQAVAAPFASRQLADLGARVIKIERPGTGDFARGYDTSVKGLASHFVWTNRSKESVTLDLKRPEAVEALRRLIARADVFLHNLAPGAMTRLGFGATALHTAHPRLVTCEISGYGTSGPYRDKKAYDLLVQSEAGLVSITGTEETPSKVGISIADIAAGMYAYSGILAALVRRERTGEGATLEVSLFDALAEWMGYPAYFTEHGGAPPPRTGARHAAISPYGPYAAGDGKVIYLASASRSWRSRRSPATRASRRTRHASPITTPCRRSSSTRSRR
jgi:itaconate CoA-transferase